MGSKADEVDKLLRGVPLDPLLWPRLLGWQAVSAGLFFVQAEEQLAGEEESSGPRPCGAPRTPPRRPWPSSVPVGLRGG